MSAFSDYLEQGVLNHTLRGQSLTAPTATYVALFTSDPTDAGTGAEVSDSGYARQDAAQGGGVSSGWSAPTTSGIGYQSANAKTLEFPPLIDSQVTVTHFGVFDTATGGNLLYHGQLDVSRTMEVNDVVTVSAGSLTITLE